MSFVADLRDAIYGFHFADRRLLQSHNHRADPAYIKIVKF